ncbi:hypothetical protein [Streptomyces collinus]|uniref:hypothetical protein n=1 Tax=Streptomyces collinus TaxID=42684 RepID=UPI002941F0FE|nr:hypothetical protein [Streptomyces collinus]
MYGKGSLAATGVGFTLFGMDMSLSLVAAFAVAAVVLGAFAYRQARRKQRYVA